MNPDEQPTPLPTPPGSDATNTQTPKAPDNQLLMSILAYLGPLVFIPLLMVKDNPSVRFHTKQGLVLFIAAAIVWVLGNYLYMFLFMLVPLLAIVNLGILILSIIGIINVINKKEAELPLVGGLAKHLTI